MSDEIVREEPVEREVVTAVPREEESPRDDEDFPRDPRKARIIPVENGFIIEIGCKKFVAEEWNKVSKGLELYFKDPKAAEKKYCK